MSLPSPVEPPHDPYAPLRIRNFRWFVASILTMAMGAQIQGVVVAWQMYEVTRDPLALGLVGLAEAAPFVGFALYAGHVADVRDRRRIALTALVLFACAAGLGVWRDLLRPGRPPSPSSGRLRGDRRRGATRSSQPARNALSADRSRALFPTRSPGAPASGGGSRCGPALGGLLLWLGPTRSYAISAALMAASLFTVTRVRAPAPPSAHGQRRSRRPRG
jgi:hypothetical protein